MLYGVSYYPEYYPQALDRIDTDIEMMRAAGINCARLADSVWAMCEPRDGDIDVSWLGPIMDELHDAQISMILCTPSYAIPAWLARDHPDVMNVAADGSPLPYGDRQNMDFGAPIYRDRVERIIRALLDAYGAHPGVIGVQLDNETGGRAIHTERAVMAFRHRMRGIFDTIDELNDAWGLNYWSHRLNCFDELWRPAGNTNPGYDLEWRRFQADLVTEFLQWQADITREYLRDDQFLTHDMVAGHGLPHADRAKIGAVVDVAAENFPHHTQDALEHPPAGRHPATYHDPSGVHGAYQLFQRADMARTGGHQNFLITEMNPISVGGSAHNFPAYDGQWRLAAYVGMSRGANAVAYWHWHSLHFGAETYSHGVLNHGLEPNRCYAEISRVGAELCGLEDQLNDLAPDADVCLLYSPDSRYGLEFQPCLTHPGTDRPDPNSYQKVFDVFYRAFFDARAQLTVTQDPYDLQRYPVVVAPAYYIADDHVLAALVDYARSGGHLVITFRSGYADERGRARWERAPGPLRKAAAVGYNLYSNLEQPVPVRSAEGFALHEGACAQGWMDELQLEGADPLVWYDHHSFGRYPAITTHQVGAGRISYVGTCPNPQLGRSVAEWVLNRTGISPLGAGLPEPVRVTAASQPSGDRLMFITNFSHDEKRVSSPVSGQDLMTGGWVDQEVELAPWDVRILFNQL